MLSVCVALHETLYAVPNHGNRWLTPALDVMTLFCVGDRSEQAGRRLQLIVLLNAGVERRLERRGRDRHARIADLRVDPVGLQIRIVLERQS